MKTLIALLFCSTLAVGCGQYTRPAIAPGHRLSLRLADSQPNSNYEAHNLGQTDQTVFVSPSDLVVRSEFLSVRPGMDEYGYPSLSFRVDEATGARLQKATSANKGKMIAVVIDGEPILTIPVVEPFSDLFRITGKYTDQEIDDLYSAITGYE